MAYNRDFVPIEGRLEQALELLETTNKPLSQISTETGFGVTGEALVTKLVEADMMTEQEIRDRAKAARNGTYAKE